MITDTILTVVLAVAQAIFAALPTASLAELLDQVSATATLIGTKLAPWDGVLPVSEFLGLMVLLCAVWLPALLLYKVANWVWRHVPSIAGFGLGGG